MVAAWSGAAVLGFELAGARLLMPVYGLGLEVWGAVIATTLVSLALGNWVGGRVADSRPGGLAAVAVLAGSGLCLLLLRYLGAAVVRASLALPWTWGAWCSAAAVLAPPLLPLGMLTPILARLIVESPTRTGRAIGALLATGTIGGVAGTVLTALVLLPRLGVSQTLLLLGTGNLVAAASLLFRVRRGRTGLAALLLTVVIGSALWCLPPRDPQLGPMRVLDRAHGLYGELEVLEHRGYLSLVCNGVFQTTLPTFSLGVTPGDLLRSGDCSELIPYYRPQARTLLLIGLGGGVHERALAWYGIGLHCVEIDPAVVALARKHFHLRSEVAVADGRAFLRRETGLYDAILIDTFLGATPPEHLYTQEAFQAAKARLSPGGLLVIHCIGHPEHLAARAVARTVQSVFPHFQAAGGGARNGLQHLYFFASEAPLVLHRAAELADHGFTGQELCEIEVDEAPVLTDDRTCLGVLSREIARAYQRASLTSRRSPPW